LTTNVTGILPVANGGTGVTSSTGTGSVVLSNSPTITLANATGLPIDGGTTGTLPIGRGGTGTTSTTYCSLTTNVSGTLPVANGGTGAATLTANNVLLGNGTSAVQAVAPSTSGNVLVSNGTTWTSSALTATQVGNAYAGLSADSIGSQAMAILYLVTAGSTYAFGSTISGANLRPCTASGDVGVSPSTLSGTWRCMGRAVYDDKNTARNIAMWLRIS